MNYPAYPTYRESGVAWLGAVPEHWEVKASRYGFQIQLGKMLQPKAGTNCDHEVPYLKSQHVQWELVRTNDLPAMWASDFDEKKYGVNDGDLLVCEGGDVGRSGIVRNPPPHTIIQNAVHRVRSQSNNLRFLMFVLEHAASQRWFEILCNRSTIAHFTGEKFGALRIPFPPLSEQTAIADFLDRETGRIDTLIEKKRRLIGLLREKRSALISRTVTRGLPADAAREFGLDPHTRFRDSGIEWLGEVPEGWEVKRLSYLALLKSGENITSEQIAEGGQYPVYGGNGMRGYFSDYTHEGFFVLVGRQGALCGNINYASDRFWASEHAIVVNPLKRFSVTWLGELLRAMNLNQYSVSAAQPGLSVSQIGALKIPVPPICEQTAIATYLDRETAKIDKLSGKVEEAIERLQEYRTALITAAVTGKIDVRYAAESAWRYGLAAEEGEAYG